MHKYFVQKIHIFTLVQTGSQINCDFSFSVNTFSYYRFSSLHLSVLLLCLIWDMSRSHTSHWACESRPFLLPQAIIKWHVINEFCKWTSQFQFPATSLCIWYFHVLIFIFPFFSVLVIITYSFFWVSCVLKILKIHSTCNSANSCSPVKIVISW